MTQRASTLDLPSVRWLRDLLWPGSDAAGSGRRYAVVLRRGRPRYVVPLDQPAVLAAVVGRSSADTGPLRRTAQRTIAVAARAGLLQPLLRTRFGAGTPDGGPPLEDHLAAAMGVPRVHVVASIGPPRPNAKPVLQLLTDEGRTLGFAKIGWNGLTRGLVTHEAETLRRLEAARTDRIEAPRLLDLGTWRGLDVSILSPLEPTPRSEARGRHPSTAELVELVGIDGPSSRALVGSTYETRLRNRIDALETPRRPHYAAALDRIVERADGAVLTFGFWHGDWTPWNMIALTDRLLVWDWERSCRDVPALLDVCHYVFQREWLRRGQPPGDALADAIRHARSHAPAFELDEPRVRIIAGLYLLELALRYTENATAGTGELRGERHAMVDTELERFVASL